MDYGLLKLIVVAVLAIYEVVARIAPSVKDFSIVGTIINLLKKLSDYLNNLK